MLTQNELIQPSLLLTLYNTGRVAYYEHSFIMNQVEGPNKYTPIAFVLNQVRLI